MAWTITLVNGTETLALNDGTAYQVLPSGFYAPPPPKLSSYSGAGLFRHGEDLVARSYGNRTVGIALSITGTNASQLGSRVQSVWEYLRKAEEWSKEGLGTQVQLRYQWEGATGTYLFNVIEGNLDLGHGLHSAYLLMGTRVRGAQLELICEPFIVQPSETLQNWIKDPSFEVANTPLADWAIQGTGSSAHTRTTADSYRGTSSLQMMRGNVSSDHWTEQFLTVGVTSGQNWVYAVWVKQVLAEGGFGGKISVAQITTAGAETTSTVTTFTSTAWAKVTGSFTTTADTGTLRMRLGLGGGPAGSGTVRFDAVYLSQQSALPVAWVSGRDVANHYDDNGQAHINYLDVYGLPGDVPAPVQIRINEVEAHDEVWVGAAHAGRVTGTKAGYWLEGESFTSTIGPAWAAVAEAADSNGSMGTMVPTASGAAAPDVIMQNIAVPVSGQYRVIARVRQTGQTGTTTAYMAPGYQYGGITVDPSGSASYTKLGVNLGSKDLFDLGAITIPPAITPQGGTIGTLGIRLALYCSQAPSPTSKLEVDYVHLMPIDQGGAYGSKTAAADNMWLDSITVPQALYRVTTAGVLQSFVSGQQGAPPLVHPQASRYYFQFGSANSSVGHGATVSISYIPRYLSVGT